MYPTLDELAALVGDSPEALRFIEKLTIGPVPPWAPHLGPCLIWTRARNSNGYGTFHGTDISGRRRQMSAHIWAFERINRRPVQPGHELDHICHDWRYCTPEKSALDPHRACVIHGAEKPVRENRLRSGTNAGTNSRRRERALTSSSPVLCTGKYGPHDLSLPGNQYFAPGNNKLYCRPCRTEHSEASKRRKKAALLQAAGTG